MNKLLLITYDLSEPGRNYEDLLNRIKQYNAWARLGGSSYLVVTNSSPVDVRDYLMEVLDNDDQLFVSLVKAPAAWTGLSEDVSSWIKDKIT